jgi:RNA-binding protein Nova
MPKKKISKTQSSQKNGRTTRTRRETTDDDDGVKPAFGSSVRAENARGLSKRRRRFRYVLDFVFLYILRDDESLLYWSKILDRMNSFKVVFLVLTRKLSLSLSLSLSLKITGKGGATINELQTSTNCRIQLTRTGEVFPGTSERVLTLSGELPSVLTAVHLISTKLQSETNNGNNNNNNENNEENFENTNTNTEGGEENKQQTPKCRLVIPNAAAGCVLGKGGATIKSFIEDSEAEIRLSSQNQAPPGCHDRILTISGTIGQILRAVALMAANLLEDQNYATLVKRPSTYRPSLDYGRGGSMDHGREHYNNNHHHQQQHNVDPQNVVSATMQVDDSKMGPILGKGGRTITEIQVSSGCRIKVSDRNDFVPGTNLRTLQISGSVTGVQLAWEMLEERLRKIEADAS